MKVRVVPCQPHCFLYGGFDMQMYRTMEALRKQGIDAEPLDYWSRDQSFDVLHVWGLESRHQNVIRLAKQYNKKVIITPLLPYFGWGSALRHLAGLIEGRRRPMLDILSHVDKLLVVNELHAEFAIRVLRVPTQKISIIPTILDINFFNTPENPIKNDCGFYFVCAGNILPRKNQLRLAHAAIQTGVKVVFVGNVMGGYQAYTDKFEKLVESSNLLTWHKWLSNEDLILLLKNSSGVTIPSFQETQPASGLEASALGKPLLLGDCKYATQKYFKNSLLCDPSSVRSIASGLSKIIENPLLYVPPKNLINDCHPLSVGIKLKSILNSL